MIAIIATAIACFIVGGILSYILFRYVLKSKYDNVLKDCLLYTSDAADD